MICIRCQADFTPKPKSIAKTCGKRCAALSIGRVPRSNRCQVCGRNFKPLGGFPNQATCSKSCAGRLRGKHGHAKDGHHSAEYRVHSSMLTRCTNPKHKSFDAYGGRGIAVCVRWHDFANFLADMGPRPSSTHSIERRDVNGDYEPGNCVWATSTEQSRNRRDNVVLAHDGMSLCVADWGERLGLNPTTILGRLARGWPVDRALDPMLHGHNRGGPRAAGKAA